MSSQSSAMQQSAIQQAKQRPPTLPINPSGLRSTSSWGMLMLILTEAAFFATMIVSYFYVRFTNPVWPLDGIKPPELLFPSIGTALLIGSSIAIYWGERGIKRGSQSQLKLGVALTFIFGLIFIGIQAHEYLNADFRPDTNAYGSLFFTITGIHGLHVVTGLIMAAVLLVWAFGNRFTKTRHEAVSNISLYWHFVDAVWLVVFTSLYLSAHW